MAFRKVAEFKEVSLTYASNGAATLQFYTDSPGGTLAARLSAGVTLPSTTGTSVRKTITVPLDGIEGTEYYFDITPGASTQLKLFSGLVHIRPIGVFLDGATSPQGEVWKMQPQSIGA